MGEPRRIDLAGGTGALVEMADGDFFDRSLDHLCVAGFDGYWKRLNPSWTRTLGWTEDEMMRKPLIEFCHPDDRAATLAARRRLTEGVPLRGLTNRYRCKDGTYRWFEWRSVSHVDRRLVYATARDVTGSARAIAAGVAHEINNPLQYVMANLEMIAEELAAMDPASSTPRVVECTEMAQEARTGAERIRRVVQHLIAFSRAEEERRELLDLRSVVEVAVEHTSHAIGRKARLVKQWGATPDVEADPTSLVQVFVHLLSNAAQAVPDGDAERHEVRVVTCTDAGGRAVVEVCDTGPGIPRAVLDRMFDPFFTTKPAGVGSGLGLPLCHAIISRLGGRISAVNRPEGGAVFRVSVPPAPRVR